MVPFCSAIDTWRRIRARAGLDDARIHDLRHSFASRALALGESLPMIGKLLGHTQVQTTARYAHLANDTVKASGWRVGDNIGLLIAPAEPSQTILVTASHPMIRRSDDPAQGIPTTTA